MGDGAGGSGGAVRAHDLPSQLRLRAGRGRASDLSAPRPVLARDARRRTGTQRIQPIWVDDVAAYFAKSVDLVGAASRTFEIGGPDVVTWDELYSRIATLLGKRRVKLHVPFGLMRVQARVIDAIPGPSPITPDQVKMIEAGDNVATNDDARATFDVALVPLDEQLRRAA